MVVTTARRLILLIPPEITALKDHRPDLTVACVDCRASFCVRLYKGSGKRFKLLTTSIIRLLMNVVQPAANYSILFLKAHVYLYIYLYYDNAR